MLIRQEMQINLVLRVISLLLITAFTTAAQDVSPAFRYEGPDLATKQPTQHSRLSAMLWEGRWPGGNDCSQRRGQVKFRLKPDLSLDSLVITGDLPDTLKAFFRQRLQQALPYFKTPRLVNGKPARSRWYIIPVYVYSQVGCPGGQQRSFLYHNEYQAYEALFDKNQEKLIPLQIDGEEYLLCYPILLESIS